MTGTFSGVGSPTGWFGASPERRAMLWMARRRPVVCDARHHYGMSRLMPGVRREDLVPVDDPGEGLRIAREAARQLAAFYGPRLRQVVLFGSWVRGEAHEESDVDLIVIVDQVDNRARERDRLVDVLYDLELDSRRAIQAFPVAEADAQSGERAFVATALRDGTALLGRSS